MPDIDKRLVALRFGSRVQDYDAATPVQRGMQQDLLDRAVAGLAGSPVRSVLELGCGTGGLTARLATQFPAARITAVDLAAEMIAHVRNRGLPVEAVVADAEAYVRGDAHSQDLIISNATFQWFSDPRGAFTRCVGLLAPGGVLAVSTFGDRTFHELADAFESAYRAEGVAPQAHVLAMPSRDDWRAWCPAAEVSEREVRCVFPDVRSFLRAVKDAGAALSVRERRPIPRRVLIAMEDRYRTLYPATSDPGSQGVVATYHVITLLTTASPADERNR
jgi:malonyl-CoA O-methyltransferase